jgi:hypothetical protein
VKKQSKYIRFLSYFIYFYRWNKFTLTTIWGLWKLKPFALAPSNGSSLFPSQNFNPIRNTLFEPRHTHFLLGYLLRLFLFHVVLYTHSHSLMSYYIQKTKKKVSESFFVCRIFLIYSTNLQCAIKYVKCCFFSPCSLTFWLWVPSNLAVRMFQHSTSILYDIYNIASIQML